MERRRQARSTSERLRQIVEIARSLIEGPLEERLRTAIEHAPRALGLTSASIFLVREDFAGFGDRLALAGVQMIDVQPRQQGLTAQVASTGRTLVVENTATHASVNPQVPAAGIGSFLAVPLNSTTGTLGVMYLNQAAPRKFSREDVRLAEAIGNMVGQAVANARLVERELEARRALEEEREHLASLTAVLNRSLAEAELLREVGQGAGAAMDLRELLGQLLDRLRRDLPVDGGSILLRVHDQLMVGAVAGNAGDRHVGQRLRRSQQLLWRVLDTGEPELEGAGRARGPSTALVPLRWRTDVFGVLELHGTGAGTFDIPELNLLRKVADQIAGWINTFHR